MSQALETWQGANRPVSLLEGLSISAGRQATTHGVNVNNTAYQKVTSAGQKPHRQDRGAGLGNVRAEGRSERILRKQRLSEDLGVSVENQGPTGRARADTGAGPVPVAGQSAGGGRARDEFGGSLMSSLVTSLLGLGLDQRGRTTSGSGAHTPIRTS